MNQAKLNAAPEPGAPAPVSFAMRALGLLCAGALRALHATLRLRWVGDEHQLDATVEGPCIYALWHGEQLPLLTPFRGAGRVILISLSHDGTLLNEVVRRLGYRTCRGSSSRGGAAGLAALADAAAQGLSPVLAVDGPRGPRGSAKTGAVRLAAASGLPILPIRMMGTGIRLRTWDRFFIPLPFSRVTILRGAPLRVPRGMEEGEIGRATHALNAALEHLGETTGPAEDKSCRPAERSGGLVSGDAAPEHRPTWQLRAYLTTTLLLGPMIELMWRALSQLIPSWRPHRLERLAFYERQPHVERIWLHGASLGEAMVAQTLLELPDTMPAATSVCMTATSQTGRRMMRDSLSVRAQAMGLGPLAPAFLAPLDLPGPTRRAFDRLRPAALILIETELWPWMLQTAATRSVPVLLVNGRISDHTFWRYHRLRPLFAPLLGQIRVIARSRPDAARFRALGVRATHCRIGVDLKSARTAEGHVPPPADLLEWFSAGPVWIAASTHPGEERLVLRVFERLVAEHPSLRLLVAPRHPERCLKDAVWRGLARRSELATSRGPHHGILVLDTLGELRTLLPYSFVTFVGGTLVPIGGHNLFEVARAGKVCLYGPHVEGVKEQCEVLEREGGGIPVRDAEHLLEVMRELLAEPESTRAKGARAEQAVSAFADEATAIGTRVRAWLTGGSAECG